MAKFLNVFGRARIARVLDPVGTALLRAGISPNVVTVAGTLGVLIGSMGFAARGYIFTALVIVTLSALTDLVDGAMARAKGGGSKFGAFLDSTMDRIADGAIFGSIAFWLSGVDRLAAVAALICLVAGQVISYIKARAESLGMSCDVGIAERAERLILIGVAGLLYTFGVPYAFAAVLWFLAALSMVTIGQRFTHVYRQAKNGGR